MSKVVATTVLPEDSGEVLTFGDTGDAIAISGDSLNVNVIEDAGGNNMITSDGAGTLTVNSAFGGAFNLLNTNVFFGATTSNFTTLIDSTYDVYRFTFTAMNPASDNVNFTFQCSIDGGSNYNVTMTTTSFEAINPAAGLSYMAGDDQAQGTSYQHLCFDIGNATDECCVGELYLFNPSSTTYVKNWYCTSQGYHTSDYTINDFTAGYFNTTSALNAISFKMSSGIMDGEIKMYGISKS